MAAELNADSSLERLPQPDLEAVTRAQESIIYALNFGQGKSPEMIEDAIYHHGANLMAEAENRGDMRQARTLVGLMTAGAVKNEGRVLEALEGVGRAGLLSPEQLNTVKELAGLRNAAIMNGDQPQEVVSMRMNYNLQMKLAGLSPGEGMMRAAINAYGFGVNAHSMPEASAYAYALNETIVPKA